ncbi:hypothetical protein QY97_01665 [Bacillus thermotolerans]|nr:hypothetical protein QY97_01665 [Bacillus thermotolerans]
MSSSGKSSTQEANPGDAWIRFFGEHQPANILQEGSQLYMMIKSIT